MGRLGRIAIMSCLIVATGALAASPAAAAPRAPSSDDVTTGKALVTQFFTLIQKKDTAGLDKMLSPAFQLERADGTGSGKAEYLKALPTLNSFELSDFSASRVGNVLVVRYLATATGVVNGKPYAPGPAPRLSVFARNGKKWQIVAHANFNPLTG
jgi:ketosteroid isomerase-like protein